MDITIAQILGLSKVGIFMSIALERTLVMALGMITGTFLGLLLSNWILGFLDITADGLEAIPPMVITLDQTIAQFVYVVLISTLCISIILAFLSVLKLNTSEILRNGNR
jgi:ABC-type lipoprotein release transport system permease subunit